ncbi:MAG: hypothetical protein ACD_73C00539G0002, partial [uncultured bacterium]
SSAMGGFDLNKWEKGGGEKGDGSEGNCYGLDMGNFLNKASDGGADEGTSPSSGTEAFDKYQKQVNEVYNNVVGANKGTEVSSGYTVSTAVQPSGSGFISATTQTATVTVAPGGMSYNVTYTNQNMTSSDNGQTWAPGSTTSKTMTGQSGAAISASFKGALTNAAHSVVTQTLEKNGGSGGGKYGNATVVVSNGSGKTNSWSFMPANEDTGSDSPCDGEKDHTAFAECVGTPGTGGGLGLANPNAGLPNCSDYFSENGRPSPVADGGNVSCNHGGCSVECPTGSACQSSSSDNGPTCQGDSNALILYATNPNIPLWDPQPMMEAQQKATPAVTKMNQSKTQSATQQKTTKQAVSPTPTGKQGSQSKPSEKDGANASSGKLPLKPVGGAKPGSAPGTPPPPKPKPGI